MPRTMPPPSAPPHLTPVRISHVPVSTPTIKSRPVPAAAPVPEPVIEEKPVPEPEKVVSVCDHLRRELANTTVAWWNYKVCHWATSGQMFVPYHELFDRLAGEAYDDIDSLAERLRMADEPVALPTLESAQAAAAIATTTDGQSMRDMVELSISNAEVVIKGMKAASVAADQAHDIGTIDLLSKAIQSWEKARWFLSQMLVKEDGLVR